MRPTFFDQSRRSIRIGETDLTTVRVEHTDRLLFVIRVFYYGCPPLDLLYRFLLWAVLLSIIIT